MAPHRASSVSNAKAAGRSSARTAVEKLQSASAADISASTRRMVLVQALAADVVTTLPKYAHSRVGSAIRFEADGTGLVRLVRVHHKGLAADVCIEHTLLEECPHPLFVLKQ